MFYFSYQVAWNIDRTRTSDSDLVLSLIILVLFLPPFLLSTFSTLNLRDKSSLKILYRHPSLIILPTVTFFTFSRHNISCCSSFSENNRVSFSKKLTWVNIAFSIIAYVAYGVRMFISLDPASENFLYSFIYFAFFLGLVLFLILPLNVLTILLTALFLHTDKLCCCCCDPREQLSVYDPDLDKRMISKQSETGQQSMMSRQSEPIQRTIITPSRQKAHKPILPASKMGSSVNQDLIFTKTNLRPLRSNQEPGRTQLRGMRRY